MKIQVGTDVREMTTEEQKNHDKVLQDQAEITQQLEAAIAARSSAQAKLAALGLTDDEIAALLP